MKVTQIKVIHVTVNQMMLRLVVVEDADEDGEASLRVNSNNES